MVTCILVRTWCEVYVPNKIDLSHCIPGVVRILAISLWVPSRGFKGPIGEAFSIIIYFLTRYALSCCCGAVCFSHTRHSQACIAAQYHTRLLWRVRYWETVLSSAAGPARRSLRGPHLHCCCQNRIINPLDHLALMFRVSHGHEIRLSRRVWSLRWMSARICSLVEPRMQLHQTRAGCGMSVAWQESL